MFEGIFGKKEEETVKGEKKAAFHITIRNNETGEILHDAGTDAFICAYDQGESTAGCSGIRANSFAAAGVVTAAQDQIHKLVSKKPEVAFLVSLEKTLRNKKETDDEGENPTE